MVASYGLEQLVDSNVGAHDRVKYPFETEIGDAFGVLFERVQAADLDGAAWGEAFAGEEAEEGGFARAVVTDSGRGK